MSEYQYYEFQTVERKLTQREKGEIEKLSSRVKLSSTRAIFEYSYGDFPAQENQILANYFDALFYIANWGTIQLMFRFPQSLVKLDELEMYCQHEVSEYLSFELMKDNIILTMNLEASDGFGWVEGEGYLDGLIELRQDILERDYRCLYLMWLKAISELELEDESVIEPPIPPGLKQLSSGLTSLIELFNIDQSLVKIAAESSPQLSQGSEADLRVAIQQLSRSECEDILLQLAKGDTEIRAKLNQKLAQFSSNYSLRTEGRRKVKSLLKEVHIHQEQECLKQQQQAEAQRIKALEKLAQKEPETWQNVERLITTGTSKSYDEVVQLLTQLSFLAVYQNQESVFRSKMAEICERYSRRSGLLRRLKTAGLYV